MQFNTHLVIFLRAEISTPKWEISFVPYLSDLSIYGRSAVFNHKDEDSINLDTD